MRPTHRGRPDRATRAAMPATRMQSRLPAVETIQPVAPSSPGVGRAPPHEQREAPNGGRPSGDHPQRNEGYEGFASNPEIVGKGRSELGVNAQEDLERAARHHPERQVSARVQPGRR